jgi:hypothetical protein
MHNIDRTNLESTYGEYSQEYSGEYAGEYPQEYAGEYAGEYTGEYAGEFPGEYGMGEFGQGETQEFEGGHAFETYGEYSQESAFSEAQEMELAAELLSVSNEAELEQFLGSLFKKAAGFIKGPIGQKLLGTVKGLAKKALPMLGSAVGNMIVPGLGGVIGGKLASAAGGMFGLELEGLSYEDQEFEVAKQIVRLGGAAAVNAAQAPSSAPPEVVARQALTAAAQQYAPGLLRNGGPTGQYGRRRHRCSHSATGRWIRRGNSILLLQA